MRKGFRLRPLLENVERPFDQTNGQIRFEETATYDASRNAVRLMAAGVAVSTITAGLFAGN